MQAIGEPLPHTRLSKLAEPPKKQLLTAQRVTSSSLFPYKFYCTIHLYWKQLPSFLQQHTALLHQDFLCFQSPLKQCLVLCDFFSFFPQTQVFTKAPLNCVSFSNYVGFLVIFFFFFFFLAIVLSAALLFLPLWADVFQHCTLCQPVCYVCPVSPPSTFLLLTAVYQTAALFANLSHSHYSSSFSPFLPLKCGQTI